MKKIVLVDSAYPINTRTRKIADSLGNEFGRENVFIIAWNRDGREISSKQENEFIFTEKAAYGSKIKKLLKLFSFRKFTNDIIRENSFGFVIASHWDVLWSIDKSHKYYSKLIYENLDIPTSQNKFVLKILQKIEKRSLRKTDAIIFASRFYIPLYDFYSGEKILLENKPLEKQFVESSTLNNKNEKKLQITFLGVLRYKNILENLISAIKDFNNIVLNIYGDGLDYEALKLFSKDIENVKMFGRYEQSSLSSIYEESDIIWAVYPNKDFNVKYAISNKFHESLMYAKPCIYAEKTKLGDFVSDNNIGFTVNPYSIESIKELLGTIIEKPELLKIASANLGNIYREEPSWNDDFFYFIEYLKK